MRFKLIMALVDDYHTENILNAARKAGAAGATVVTSAHGEGITPEKTFLGLEIAGHRDPMMFLLVKQISRKILKTIAKAGEFDQNLGAASHSKLRSMVLTEEIEK